MTLRANRLIDEKSPYLLQHAHNPVDWFPWGEEAFQKATREGKPVFLSLGYSTCHWCHVMERESFEDEEVAEYLNKHFIAIKVDREERPDIDQVYMEACAALTGQGGWPLTLVLTPDGKPFFAGTYFPKTKKYGHIGLLELLPQIVAIWQSERHKAEEIGASLTDALREITDMRSKKNVVAPEPAFFDALYDALDAGFDERFGGFGDAPKFPSPHNLLFLLRHHAATKEAKALDMALVTLEHMHRGGMYDHIGGGFARYSTDRKWLIPHFEKMLYDNALLAHAYLDAYHATKDPVWKEIAKRILDYALRDMATSGGAFCAAEDADSEGEEGKYYIFSDEEIQSLLGSDADLFQRYFGVTKQGNFEGNNVLHLQNVSADEWRGLILREGAEAKRLQASCDKIYDYREQRVHPFKDDKVLLGWNALLISALGKAARLLGEQKYLDAAIRAWEFIEQNLKSNEGRYYTRFREGEAKHPAYLDDYAFFAWANLELYETTFAVKYLERALHLTREMRRLFWDYEQGGYFLSGIDAERLIARAKSWFDGALPSGNSTAAYVLARLALLTGDEKITAERDEQIRAGYAQAAAHPIGNGFFALALQQTLLPTKEIVLATANKDQASDWINAVQSQFLPLASLLVRTDETAESLDEMAPFTTGQNHRNGGVTAYICENFACHAPTESLEVLLDLLA